MPALHSASSGTLPLLLLISTRALFLGRVALRADLSAGHMFMFCTPVEVLVNREVSKANYRSSSEGWSAQHYKLRSDINCNLLEPGRTSSDTLFSTSPIETASVTKHYIVHSCFSCTISLIFR